MAGANNRRNIKDKRGGKAREAGNCENEESPENLLDKGKTKKLNGRTETFLEVTEIQQNLWRSYR